MLPEKRKHGFNVWVTFIMGLEEVIFERLLFKAILLDMLLHFLRLVSPFHLNKPMVQRGGNGHLLTRV